MLGEQANWQPVCNATNKCVLYVGKTRKTSRSPNSSRPLSRSARAQSGTAPATTRITNQSRGTVRHPLDNGPGCRPDNSPYRVDRSALTG